MIGYVIIGVRDMNDAKAIEVGATSEGEPGPRTPTFYGCYLRDPDGNMFAFYKMG